MSHSTATTNDDSIDLPDPPRTADGRLATVWIDTNVMNEIYSKGDLYRDANRGDAVISGRLKLLRGSLWFAMALDEQGATTVSFEGECRDTILSLAPPESEAGAWTSEAVWKLRRYVFPSWNPCSTQADLDLPKGKEGNNDRDLRMVRLAKKAKLTLVTRDKQRKRGQSGAYRLAQDEGVPVMTPDEYAATVLTREAARDRFLERFGRYVEVENTEAAHASMRFHRGVWDCD